MKRIYLYILIIIGAFCMGSCDDMTDAPVNTEKEVIAPEAGTAEIYVLNEGLFNLNNSTLMRYSFSNG
ncbi:MAG: hypothetical protein AB7S64_08640, partial [Bacteroides sp.]